MLLTRVRGAKHLLRRALAGLAFALVPTALEAAPPAPAAATDDAEVVTGAALAPWSGDFEGIVKRGTLRMAIAPNPIFYSYDGEEIRGIAVEVARAFEEHLHETHGARVDVVLLPFKRDDLLPALLEGRADVVAANLTITAERSKDVAFSDPLISGVTEVVVTGPGAPDVNSFDDLVAHGLHLRPSSSYAAHLEAFNAERRADGQPEIPMVAMDEAMEDYDLLEQVAAGDIPAIVIDNHKADLWRQVFDGVTVHDDLALNREGAIGWAMRPDAPDLKEVVDAFVATIKRGTLLGNIFKHRYFDDPEWVEHLRANPARSRFDSVAPYLKKYARAYGFDWRLIMAQAYQESRLDNDKRSAAGAVGVMQVRPATAADPNVDVPNVTKLENNIHAGVKYLRFLQDRYFSDGDMEPMDRLLMSLAAYNAGPANIRKARAQAESMNLSADEWFGNVEAGAARVIGREPVTYVRNIYKFFTTYALMDQSGSLQ